MSEGLQLYKKQPSTQVLSCETYEDFKNTYFVEHLQTAASNSCCLFSLREKVSCRYFPFVTLTINWYSIQHVCLIRQIIDKFLL